MLTALDLRTQLYTYITELHQKGVAHGDLAERNVVVREGRVEIIDFGEAYLHKCKGEGECGELEALRESLRMWVSG